MYMYSPINRRKLGKIAQNRRKMMGWNQTQIAMEIGCDIRSVSQFESGYTSSWRILVWYLINDIIDNETIRKCGYYE